jgi:dihydrofolate reductase
MGKLTVFNNVSLDGYFTDANGDMSWAHRQDPEWLEFVSGNAAAGQGMLVFGRVTYDMMRSYWPTPMALEQNPVVAQAMNDMPKVVFSRTLGEAGWQNTRLLTGDIVEETRRLKESAEPDMVIMGSGTIVAQLAAADLIDEYQLVVNPIVLGAGRTLFQGVPERKGLVLKKSRAFGNGNIVSWYAAPGTD